MTEGPDIVRFYNRTSRYIFLLVLCWLGQAAHAGEWQHFTTPWGETQLLYKSIVFVPGEGLLVVANGSAHLSRDDAASWEPMVIPGDYISDVVASPQQPDNLYASSVVQWDSMAHPRVEILHSLDAGRSWVRLSNDSFCVHLALTLSGVPAYCFDRSYSSSFVPAVMRSRDAGQSWSRIDPENLGMLAGVNGIAVTPWTALVSNRERMSFSRDGGESWQDATGAPTGITGSAVVDSRYPSRVFVGTEYGLFQSRDAGLSWTHLALPFLISAVAIDPHDGALYVTFPGGVARTRDKGLNWESVSAGMGDKRVGLIAFSGQNLYVMTEDGISVCFQKQCADVLQPLADDVVEFHHAGLDHYFYTANVGEQMWLDDGGAGGGWVRTGLVFRNSGSQRVCRFYGSTEPGPNSHFYTSNASECRGLKDLQASTPDTERRWNYEGLDFFSGQSPVGADADRYCPTGTAPVYRAYNNGFARGIDSNHRLSTDRRVIEEMVGAGWIDEGIMMCVPAR